MLFFARLSWLDNKQLEVKLISNSNIKTTHVYNSSKE